MKISLITLHTVNNYGSVLQTYATQKVLEQLGHSVEVIDYWREDNLTEACVDKLLTHGIMQKYEKIWNSCAFTREAVRIPLRLKVKNDRKAVQEFLNKYVHLTEKQYMSYDELEKNPPEADVYVTGSDQVWNSIWNNGFEKAYFLEFVPEGKKKIAFSASIGRTELDKWEIEPMKNALEKYSAISMRESSGVELLQKELGIPSTLTLDPTLMLTGEQWRKLAQKTKEMDQPYLLVYQLNQNPKMDLYIEKLAKKQNLQILRIAYGNSETKKAGKCLLRPTVEQFLGAFSNAECVVTDSFHATSFSLNMGVDFISIAPPRFGTRIRSILKMTHTENRMLDRYDNLEIYKVPINKEKVCEILDQQRETSMKFLKNALEK